MNNLAHNRICCIIIYVFHVHTCMLYFGKKRETLQAHFVLILNFTSENKTSGSILAYEMCSV